MHHGLRSPASQKEDKREHNGFYTRGREEEVVKEVDVVVIHCIKKIDRKSERQQAKDEVRQQYVGRKGAFERGILSVVFFTSGSMIPAVEQWNDGTLSQSTTQQLTNNPLLFE
jgi:hypothetical protein